MIPIPSFIYEIIFHHRHIPPTFISPIWNMLTTQSSSLVSPVHLRVSYFCFNTLPSESISFSSFPYLILSHLSKLVLTNTIHLPSHIPLIKIPSYHRSSHLYLPNILTPISLQPPPLFLTFFFVALRPRRHLNNWNHFSDTRLSPPKNNQTYFTIIQPILLHNIKLQFCSPTQISKINSLHYKVLR